MKQRLFVPTTLAIILLVLVGGVNLAQEGDPTTSSDLSASPDAMAAAVGISFTYQGSLLDNGDPVNDDTCDFNFSLWDAVTSGHQVGTTDTHTNVDVVDGLFTVSLNFVATAFQGDARWLQIRVACGSAHPETLSPRQPLTAAPYALGLRPGAVISGAVDAEGVLTLENSSGDGLRVTSAGSPNATNSSSNPNGIEVQGAEGHGLYVGYADLNGVAVISAAYDGVGVSSAGRDGVVVGSAAFDGMKVVSAGSPDETYPSTDHNGIEVQGAEGNGLYVGRADLDGVYVTSANHEGVQVDSAGRAGVYVGSAGEAGLYVSSAGTNGVYVNQSTNDGFRVCAAGSVGSCSGSTGNHGVEVDNAEHSGIFVNEAGDDGVHVGTVSGEGMYVYSAGENGMRVYSATLDGVQVQYAHDDGVHIGWAGDIGVYVDDADGIGVQVDEAGSHGLYVNSAGIHGVYVNSAGEDGFVVEKAGTVSSPISSGYDNGLEVRGAQGNGVYVGWAGVNGVTVNSAADSGVYVGDVDGNGLQVDSAGLNGVYVASAGQHGVYVLEAGAGYYAGKFNGDVDVTGALTKGSSTFKIDHPLDPENQYLSHSVVESPDMMNIYNGNATLDNQGEALVELPDWFGALNQDFRYQLTAIGAPGPNLYIAEEVKVNRFKIAGGESGMKVSWQVTGIRHDPYAEMNRILVEESKPADELGTYLHPDAYGLPESQGLAYKEAQEMGGEQ